MWRLVVLLFTGSISVAALAQESPSYKLEESVFNAGGHPTDGTILTSTSHRITFGAIGEGVASVLMTGTSFRMAGSFVAAYPPAGEVQDLRFAGKATMAWDAEESTGTYNVYRDFLSTLSTGDFGSCFAQDVGDSSVTDPSAPPMSNGWFYLVTAENRLQEEGSKGYRSSGEERRNLVPCP